MGTTRADAQRISQDRAAKPKRKVANPERWLEYRVYRLPEQLARARARVAQLEAEARQYGFTDLVEQRA